MLGIGVRNRRQRRGRRRGVGTGQRHAISACRAVPAADSDVVSGSRSYGHRDKRMVVSAGAGIVIVAGDLVCFQTRASGVNRQHRIVARCAQVDNRCSIRCRCVGIEHILRALVRAGLASGLAINRGRGRSPSVSISWRNRPGVQRVVAEVVRLALLHIIFRRADFEAQADRACGRDSRRWRARWRARDGWRRRGRRCRPARPERNAQFRRIGRFVVIGHSPAPRLRVFVPDEE